MNQTGKLSGALANNQVRGSWGEVSLHRVVELAGMTDHVDFFEQLALPRGDEDEGGGRPDMVIRLPSNASVPVDAKVPLSEFLRASGETDPEAFAKGMEAHAEALAGHVAALVKRDYPSSLGRGPRFTILFLPGEAFLAAALRARPELLESAARQHVILATPTTLLSLLRAVVVGWNEQGLADRAEEIAELGRELHDRVGKVAEHVGAMGKSLGASVKAYNDMVGSIDRNLLTTASRLERYNVRSTREVPVVGEVEVRPREVPPKIAARAEAETQAEGGRANTALNSQD
jgi:DNA recombination protein RmuC